MKTKRDFCNRLFNFALSTTWDFIQDDREDFIIDAMNTPLEQLVKELQEITEDENTYEYDKELAIGLIEMAKEVV